MSSIVYYFVTNIIKCCARQFNYYTYTTIEFAWCKIISHLLSWNSFLHFLSLSLSLFVCLSNSLFFSYNSLDEWTHNLYNLLTFHHFSFYFSSIFSLLPTRIKPVGFVPFRIFNKVKSRSAHMKSHRAQEIESGTNWMFNSLCIVVQWKLHVDCCCTDAEKNDTKEIKNQMLEA